MTQFSILPHCAFRRGSANRFHKIAGEPFLVIRRCASGISKRFFLRGEKWLEPIFVDGLHESFVRRDNAFFEQRLDRVVHKLHSLGLAGNDDVLKFLRCAFANDGRDRCICDQNLVYSDSARPVHSF